MSRKWFFIWMIALWIAIGSLPLAGPVQAQTADPPPENDENCVACHEHEYYVYDTGKWFCLCEAPMHCVYCHGGQTDTTDEELAHEGMVLYPTRDHAARCRTCHTEDYMARAVTFASVAGVSEQKQPLITATPVEPAALISIEPASFAQQIVRRLDPWQVVGLVGLTVLMAVIMVFGYRCWKADCMSRSTQ